MPHDHLADFLAALHDEGELRRVSAEVDPVLEVAEIVDRVCRQPGGGPALVFERVRGSPLPLVVNLLGSPRRIARALGNKTPDEVAERMESLFLRPEVPENWLQRLKLAPKNALSGPWPPQVVKSGISQQVVKIGRDVQLFDLPALQSWPQEGGRFLGAGQVLTRNPATGERGYEMFPLEVRDRNTLLLHWHVHHCASRAFAEHRAAGTQFPIAVALGGDPLLHFLPHCPLPAHVDPLLFAGFLRSQSVDLVKARQVGLEVPACAEIVLEGFVDVTQPLETGSRVALPTGYYGEPAEAAAMQVTAITHRGNPLCVTMIPGRPPTEETWLRQAAERFALRLLQQTVPEIVDWHVPPAGGDSQWGLVSIQKTYAHQAQRVMHALWGSPYAFLTKLLVVVDADVDIRQPGQVWSAVGANVHPSRDATFASGPAANSDHAAPIRGSGSKLGLDATRKFTNEGHPRAWPDRLTMPDELRERVTARWEEFRLS